MYSSWTYFDKKKDDEAHTSVEDVESVMEKEKVTLKMQQRPSSEPQNKFLKLAINNL